MEARRRCHSCTTCKKGRMIQKESIASHTLYKCDVCGLESVKCTGSKERKPVNYFRK